MITNPFSLLKIVLTTPPFLLLKIMIKTPFVLLLNIGWLHIFLLLNIVITSPSLFVTKNSDDYNTLYVIKNSDDYTLLFVSKNSKNYILLQNIVMTTLMFCFLYLVVTKPFVVTTYSDEYTLFCWSKIVMTTPPILLL